MSNTFDEVDDILSDMDCETSGAEDTEFSEKNFNEAELQDIMNEIDSLEKELEAEVVSSKEVPRILNPVSKTDLQNEIDQELESTLSKSEETETIVEPKVLSFGKKAPIAYTPVAEKTSSEISFEAQGQMNLNLGFKIGDETARLTIDPVKGLVIVMSGVELTINQEEGCKVVMETGVKFTIPLTSSETALKKKSA